MLDKRKRCDKTIDINGKADMKRHRGVNIRGQMIKRDRSKAWTWMGKDVYKHMIHGWQPPYMRILPRVVMRFFVRLGRIHICNTFGKNKSYLLPDRQDKRRCKEMNFAMSHSKNIFHVFSTHCLCLKKRKRRITR